MSTLSLADRHRLILDRLFSVHNAAADAAPPGWLRDDLTSAAYEALVRASYRFSPASGATFSTYSFLRIRGACADALDQHLRWWKIQASAIDVESSTACADWSDPYRDLPDPLDRTVLTSQVLAAVERLPKEFRDIIKLHCLDEQDLAEVGRRLGISKTCASVRLAKAIALLRRALNDRAAVWPVVPRHTKRRFSKRFKAQVLRKALDPSTNAKQVARDLGIPPSTVWNWTAAARRAGQVTST